MKIQKCVPLTASCERRSTRGPMWFAAVMALAMAAAPAQYQFADLGKRHLPIDIGPTYAVAFADVDGDGDLDLITGGYENRLFRNDGAGVFTRVAAAIGGCTSMVVGDVDGDHDIDLVFAYLNGFLALYLNDGTGNFTNATSSNMPWWRQDVTSSLALGDVDGDGDLDLVVGNWGHTATGSIPWPISEQNRLYLNDGTGTFGEDTTLQRLPSLTDFTTAVALGDIDGDADLDLIVANGTLPNFSIGGGRNELFLNDGSGVFSNASARLPFNNAGQTVVLGDVDSDGDLDLIFGSAMCLYVNDGAGNFTDATAAHLPAIRSSTNALALGDVDGDGDLDLLAGTWNGTRLYLNDGTGTFADATAARLPWLGATATTSALAVGDVDGDGAVDLMVGNGGPLQNHLCLNDGAGVFIDAAAGHLPAHDAGSYQILTAGDVDIDGDLDLIVASVPSASSTSGPHLLQNDGTATFADVTSARLPAVGIDFIGAAALADVDGDGDLDLVIGARQNRLYLNDGSGTFTDATATRMPAANENVTSVRMFDAEGDGDLDLVTGTLDQQIHLYLNDGSGTFTEAPAGRMPAANHHTEALAVGDVDGDGDLDLVVGVARLGGDSNRLLLNDGTGTFTDSTAGRLPIYTGVWTKAVALTDVDGDGDLDLITGGIGQNRLYINNGGGGFYDATNSGLMPADQDATYALAIGDVDGDGDLDLVLGNSSQPNRLYLNDGSGTFTNVSSGRMPPETSYTESMIAGDLDGDGDLDLVTTGDRPHLYLNLQRQLDTPLLLRAGETWLLDVYARGGATAQPDLALPCLSFAGARIPLPPLGTLGIDPNVMVPLPGLLVPQPTGNASLPLPIPNLPGLAGVRVYTQALLLQPQQARFTNVVVDSFLR